MTARIGLRTTFPSTGFDGFIPGMDDTPTRRTMPASPTPGAVMQPSRIGKYRIESILGEGAMGVVYRGYDADLDRRVAIKTLRKELLADEFGVEMLARFRREAGAGSRLSHRHVVTVFDSGEEADVVYMVMEYLEGRSLRDLNGERAPWPLLEAIDLVKQLLEALDFFHERGVVHRDIKPSNIMVSAAGLLTVTDFGIAQTEASDLTQAGTLLGTPSYMSPEQISGEAIDGRSDLFAVGIVFYEMLTGEKPFRGEVITIAHHIVCSPHPDPSSLIDRLPSAVDRLFRTALAKRPEERFRNGAAFRAALDELLTDIHAQGSEGINADALPDTTPPAPPSLPVTPSPAAPAVTRNPEPVIEPGPTVTTGNRRSFDRCPRCATRFDSPRPWNAVCTGCGTALFEAAERAGRGGGSPAPRSPWLIIALVIATFIVLLLLLR
jgi:serine/threonine-protein kinase